MTGAVREFMSILGKQRVQVTALYLIPYVFEVIFLRIFAFIAKDWSINKTTWYCIIQIIINCCVLSEHA